ncbi:MAG: HAD hydrolase-like protein [Firmicutes bacterium]|nr:HAD hydrolase-like protein [Bacillota bacterium]
MIDHILFDFDGVICESIHEKTKAFHKLYLPFGSDIADMVVKHHENNLGISRYEKIKFYHKNFLEKELTNRELMELADRFSFLVIDNVVSAPLVAGLTEFIGFYKSSIDYKVISATPRDELIRIVNRKSLKDHFSDVLGSPTSKIDWIKYLIDNGKISIEKCIFIGDSNTDYEAATKFDIPFILRRTTFNQSMLKLPGILGSFEDYFELMSISDNLIN